MSKLRIIKPIVTTLLLLTLVAGIGVVGPSYTSSKGRIIATQTLPSLSHLAMANQCRGQAFLHLILAMNSNSDETFREQRRLVGTFSDLSYVALDSYSDTMTSDENRRLYSELMAERDAYVKVRNDILSYSEQHKKDLATAELTDNLLPIYTRYLEKGQDLVEYANKQGIAQVDFIRKVSRWSQILAVVSSILLFILGFFLGFTR